MSILTVTLTLVKMNHMTGTNVVDAAIQLPDIPTKILRLFDLPLPLDVIDIHQVREAFRTELFRSVAEATNYSPFRLQGDKEVNVNTYAGTIRIFEYDFEVQVDEADPYINLPVMSIVSDGGPHLEVIDPDGVVPKIEVDFAPTPTWPTREEQADALAAAVRQMYIAQCEAAS